MDQDERRILTFTSIGHFFTHFTMLLFPPLATTIALDLGMELDQVFSLSFLMYLFYGLAAIPWGLLADRWNPRLVLASGIILAGVGLLNAGIIQNPVLLPYALALTGFGNAAYHPSGLSLLSKGMSSRGKSMGINGVFGNIGIAMAPLTAGIIGVYAGWQGVFIFFGILGILGGILIASIPFSVPVNQDRQRGKGAEGSEALLLFLVLCAAVISSGLMYRTFTLVLPSWLEESLGTEFRRISDYFISGTVSGSLISAIVTSLAMIVGMGGQIAGGRVADMMDLRKAYLLFFSLALPFLLASIFISGWLKLPLLGFFVFFALGMQPIENSLYSMLVPPRWRSSGFGIKFTLAFGVGSLAVSIVARIEPKIGLDAVMMITAVYLTLTILTAGLLLLISRRTVIKHEHT